MNAFQMQQMHHGVVPGQTDPPGDGVSPQQAVPSQPAGVFSNGANGAPGALPSVPASQAPPSFNATSLDDMISGAARDADKAEAIAATSAAPKADAPAEEKKGKKEKKTQMVYSDNEVSPEEKMAQLPRYAFVSGAVKA